MNKTRFLALLSVLALLAALPLATVLAQQPVPPQKFYGMVMVDGEPAPEGTMVTATIMVMKEGEDGEMMEETVKIGDTMVDAMGNYVLTTMGSIAYVGKDVMFMVGEADAMPAMMGEDGEMMMMEDSIMYMQGERTKLNLTAGSMMPHKPTTPGTGTTGVGMRGPAGPAGEAGAAGETGPAGSSGARGARGPAGADGAVGPTGSAGPAGPAGSAGSAGSDGSDGADGDRGPAGPAGSTGPAGPAGADGPAGSAGADGADGGGGILAIIALIVAIVGVLAAGGAFMAGRRA